MARNGNDAPTIEDIVFPVRTHNEQKKRTEYFRHFGQFNGPFFVEMAGAEGRFYNGEGHLLFQSAPVQDLSIKDRFRVQVHGSRKVTKVGST